MIFVPRKFTSSVECLLEMNRMGLVARCVLGTGFLSHETGVDVPPLDR